MGVYAVVNITGVPGGDPAAPGYWKHRLLLVEDRGPELPGRVIEHLCARAATQEDAERAREMTVQALGYLGIPVEPPDSERRWDFRAGPTIRVPLAAITEASLAGAIASIGEGDGRPTFTRLVVCDHHEDMRARRILSGVSEVGEGEELTPVYHLGGLPIEIDPYLTTAYLEAVI